ncbi:MAG: 3-deoxy-7-phosphoheptulonate synthase [Chromatiales bacterium]
MSTRTDDLRIKSLQEVIPPAQLLAEVPTSERAAQTVIGTRRAVQEILHGEDNRLLVITGPCSIHDPPAARDYAGRLKPLIDGLAGDLLIIMRVYFEKPRTTVGWKGLINDPLLDYSFRINDGLHIARQLLVDLNEVGVPAATEFLDPISPQYLADLVAWGAIGARTTESQVHRELASGLSCPIGFKNSTDGGVQIAIDAIKAASQPHHFLGVTKEGRSAIVATTGNPDCHLILRGGNNRPNYDAESVNEAATKLANAGLRPVLCIDCSHANSEKDHARQVEVGREVARQISAGERRVVGVMLESHLVAGRQDLEPGVPLTYGQSITDACMGWSDTEPLLRELARAARTRRHQRRQQPQSAIA